MGINDEFMPNTEKMDLMPDEVLGIMSYRLMDRALDYKDQEVHGLIHTGPLKRCYIFSYMNFSSINSLIVCQGTLHIYHS